MPNVNPPRGNVAEFADYVDAHPDFGFQLSTFGFGAKLDSQLLLELARRGGGGYAFIPDAKIVGTCFVNAVAAAASTWAQRATLHLCPKNGARFAGPCVGALPCSETPWGRVVELGPLTLGATREVASRRARRRGRRG